VQAGRDAGDVPALAGHGGGQAVAPAAVDEPGAADLPVIAAGIDELGQGELVQARRDRGELRHHRVKQPRRDHEPAEPQDGGQALAGRAGVDDAVGRERLQRAHRLPVIPELPVVVVLDHKPGPACRFPAALRVEGHAQRELVGRGQQRGVRPGGRRDDGAAAVDRQRPQAQALRLRDGAVGLVAVRLHGKRARPGRPQRGAGDREAVREARADHDAVGIGGDAARPRQVARQRRPQLREPAPVGVVQEPAGCGHQHLAGRRQPRAGREHGQVRYSRPQVVARSGRPRAIMRAGLRARARIGGPAFGHGGSRAGPRGEPPLGDQLAVDLGHGVPCDPEVGGQGARGRQPGARAEAAGPDRLAQRGLKAEADPGAGKLNVQVHAGVLGPHFWHRNGPYYGPLVTVAWLS